MSNVKMFIGVAVEDRQLKSRELKVFLRELSPYSAGDLKDSTASETYIIKGTEGSLSGNVKTTNCVTADYFGLNSNRSFPPDIVTGEQVLVFQYADEDKYYWLSAGRDDNLRHGELVRFAASDDMGNVKTLNEDNTYFIELDTKLTKRMRLHTAKSDGEAHSYDITIDAKNSFVSIRDDAGNSIELLSDVPQIKLTNNEGSIVDLNGSNVSVIAPETVLIRAGRELIMKAPLITRTGNTVATGNVSTTGNSTTNGEVVTKGKLITYGDTVGNGGLVSNGNITVNGTLNATGSVTAPNIS